jgi:hypothetical protein
MSVDCSVSTTVACKEVSPDPLASFRRHLEESHGVLALGCGCYMRVLPEAMASLPTQTLANELTESVRCCHPPVYH